MIIDYKERNYAYRELKKRLPRDLLWIEELMTSSALWLDDTVIYVPAMPLPYDTTWQRVRCAWRVFRGKARAVQWPEQMTETERKSGDTPLSRTSISGQ